MWRSRTNRDGTTVVCIACGTSVPRSEAREYDKRGNRWERHGKRFEHLCKECYRDLCHQPRDGLESLLIDVEQGAGDIDREQEASEADREQRAGGTDREQEASEADREQRAGGTDRETDPTATPGDERPAADAGRSRAAFLARYFRAVEERYGPAEEPGRES